MAEKVGDKKSIVSAIYIGVLCAVSYLAVYFARNILGAVTPKMIENGFTESYIGEVSSVYFVCYAVGQLINGKIGDKIKAKYMISLGLLFSGVANFMFTYMAEISPQGGIVAYGLTGFFLSMIYGPMTKILAENVKPIYVQRCALGYTFASFFATPLAGVAASIFVWQSAFHISSISLVAMAVFSFACILVLEKMDVIKYNRFTVEKEKGMGIAVLIKRDIIRFTLISIITGVIRTSVIFWMPTYMTQYLGFEPETSALIFTAATFIISFAAFVAVFLYEMLKRRLNLTIMVSFSVAGVFFLALYMIKNPVINIVLMILAIMASNCAASMLFSVYCPGLRDTGMVSSATGFIDFTSYIAAAVSNLIFANAATTIGWGNLILVWFALMVVGIVVMLPYGNIIKKKGI